VGKDLEGKGCGLLQGTILSSEEIRIITRKLWRWEVTQPYKSLQHFRCS